MQGDLEGTNSSSQELILLAHDRAAEVAAPEKRGFRVLHRPNRNTAKRGRNIFVLAPASELPDVAEFVSIANRRHQLRALLVRDDVQPSSIPQMFERAGLRMMRNTVVHSDPSVPRRVPSAWTQNAQEELIAKASVSKDRLFVLSCALQPYEVAFDSMPSLKRVPVPERGSFVVDEDGSYIHWPGPDIHLDLDAIRAAIDLQARARAEGARALHDTRYGAAIAKLRLRMGLKQSQIEGLSERQVRRIEKGEGTTYEALRRLAAAHRMDLEGYLRELAINASDPALKRAIA
ncbi:MAG: hypothetical protein LC130_22290 [Bryobacterales bacterium]|nr:hypothetical protein [Bryobacterales bacterium]